MVAAWGDPWVRIRHKPLEALWAGLGPATAHLSGFLSVFSAIGLSPCAAAL